MEDLNKPNSAPAEPATQATPEVPAHYTEGSADHTTPPGQGSISDEALRLAEARRLEALERAPKAADQPEEGF